MEKNITNSPDSVISVKNLRKEWPGYVLMIPELEIPSGVVGLLGESGSGKSTLLNTLATLDPKYEGQIISIDETSDDISNPDLTRRKKYSFLFQSSNLISNFRVGQNINLSRDIRSAVISGQSTKPKDVLDPLFSNPPNNLENKFPSELSGGEKQRVAVARALLKARDGAKFLFADEPTANIDKRTAGDCINELTGWAKQKNNSLVFATHDLSIAQKNTDYLVLIGLAEGEPRESLISHYRSIGTSEAELPKPEDKVFTVISFGPTKETYKDVEDALLQRKKDGEMDIAKGEAMPIIPVSDPTALRLCTTQLTFLLKYCWRDVVRKRELKYNVIRVMAVSFLFAWLIMSASILVGVPRVADEIFKNDPLLRLVDIESVASFPIKAETMQRLANLTPTDIGKRQTGNQGQPVVAATVPWRDFSCRFYDSSGMLRNEWINGGLWAWGVRDGEDPIFDFWNLPPLTEIDGVMVHEKLLEKLGYDVADTQAKIDDPDEEAILVIDMFEKVGLRIDKIVPRFPDPLVDMILPAELANQIQLNQKEALTIDVPYISLYGYPDMTSARKHQILLQAKEEQFKQILSDHGLDASGDFYIQAERKPVEQLQNTDPVFQIVVRPPNRSAGLPIEAWDKIIEIYRGLPNEEGRKSYPVKFEKLPSSIATLKDPPREGTLATIYVNDYRDIPGIIKHIEANNDAFRVRITNKKNKEMIATVQKGTLLLRLVIYAINIAFIVISVLCLLFSFMPQVQAKLGEIGIFRAYGIKRKFIYSRFSIEMLATCLIGFCIASAFYLLAFLPWMNDFATTELPDLFAANTSGPLRFEAQGIIFSVVAGACAMLAVLLLIYTNVRKTPSELLRMAD